MVREGVPEGVVFCWGSEEKEQATYRCRRRLLQTGPASAKDLRLRPERPAIGLVRRVKEVPERWERWTGGCFLMQAPPMVISKGMFNNLLT